MSILWATRGRNWGFMFLRRGGAVDPLVAYETVFTAMGSASASHRSVDGMVGVRFPDPLGRRDMAGRTIPHEFLLTGSDAAAVTSVDDALVIIWPQVADQYARVWDAPRAPTPFD